MTGVVAGTEGDALRSAIETLDVDWPNLTEAARDKIIAAARGEVAGLASTIPPLIEPVLVGSAASIVARTRISACRVFDFSAAIKHEAPVDIETITNVVDSTQTYIKDSYGRRADEIDAVVKDVVASGLERGLGRDDISEALATKLGPLGIDRTENYFNLVAADFAQKARIGTTLNTFERAEITHYIFHAQMDQVTSEICRLLNGRVFSVEKAAKRMRHAMSLKDPEDIKNVRPWVQSGTNEAGNRDGERHTVAHVDEPGEGEMDRAGKYSNQMSNKALEAAGVTVPPAHSHCRSTIITG
jgi:hypothetical protein